MNAKMKTTLTDLQTRMSAINDELYTMPAIKLGTAWHADRCREVRYLAQQIDRLSGDIVCQTHPYTTRLPAP